MIEKDSVTLDRDLANYIIGCPSYESIEGRSRFKWVNDVMLPVFNEFQLHKSKNDLKFYMHDMKKKLSMRLSHVPDKEKKGYTKYLQQCSANYYKLFKGRFYQRYKVISLTTPYTTESIPLEHNIKGDVDLIIKTSFGITYINYVYFINPSKFYFNVQHAGTRLQIAGRCMKLISGVEPDLLCLVIFTKKSVFKTYFRYLDEPYEDYLKIYKNNLIPIKRRYCILCRTCTVKRCAPWKTKDRILI